jgi:hypothetical protein
VTKKHGNTGPKGVLSDYEDYKLWKREQKILENIETWERLKGGAASLRSENPNVHKNIFQLSIWSLNSLHRRKMRKRLLLNLIEKRD